MKKINAKNELKIVRIFDAPRALVWKAWTDSGLFSRWWGPRGFTTPVARMDVRMGGEYLNCMRSPEGKDYWSKGTYREIIPNAKLVMSDSFADEVGKVVPAEYYGMSGFPLEMQISVTFEEARGRTRLTLAHSGIANISDEARKDMLAGWSQSLDKLAELLAEVKPSKLAA